MENCIKGKSPFPVKAIFLPPSPFLMDYFIVFINCCFSTLYISEFKDVQNNMVVDRQVRSRLFVLKAWRVTGAYGSKDAC